LWSYIVLKEINAVKTQATDISVSHETMTPGNTEHQQQQQQQQDDDDEMTSLSTYDRILIHAIPKQRSATSTTSPSPPSSAAVASGLATDFDEVRLLPLKIFIRHKIVVKQVITSTINLN